MPEDEWVMSCYDCEREVGRRALQPTPVHIDHDDGPGYDRVEVPLCRGCRLKRFPTHECPECGEEWLDMTAAVECCQHRRGRPMPDGGQPVTEEQRTPQIDDLELDVTPTDASWFQSMLLNCINGLHEADHDERQRIRGRVFILRDLFNLSEGQVVALAGRYSAGDEMAVMLEVDDGE